MKIIQLTHPSHRLKTAILEKLLTHYEHDYDIEIICSALSQMFIDGVIIRALSLAFITDSIVTHDVTVTHEVNVEDMLEETLQDMTRQHEHVDELFHTAYEQFAQGLST